MGYLDLSQLSYFFNNWVGFQVLFLGFQEYGGQGSFSFNAFYVI